MKSLNEMSTSEKLLVIIVVLLFVFGAGVATGYVLHTPKVDQGDLAAEADSAKKYADKREGDKTKGDGQKGTAAESSTKIEYRNCKLDQVDFKNLQEAFKR